MQTTEETKERIRELKNLFNSGINEELFFKMIRHCTDGGTEKMTAYANRMTLDEFLKLFKNAKKDINVTEIQVQLFFEYLSKYFYEFFTVSQNKYIVFKTFGNEEKNMIFSFEYPLLFSFSLT